MSLLFPIGKVYDMVQLTAGEAAARMGTSKQWAAALARRGAFESVRLADGRWSIESSSVNRHDRIRAGAGRPWSARTSWCALAELAGYRLPNVDGQLRSRVRQRLRTSTAEELSRKVAHRVQWERFMTTDAEAIEAALTITGASAARHIAPELTASTRRVEGYAADQVRVQAMLASAQLLPDDAGNVWIAAAYTDWPFDDIAPSSVIAADLALSADPREQAAGVQVLTELQDRWLARRDE